MKLKNRLKHTTNVTFDLIGITCPENIIRLSWLINHALKLNFSADNDLLIHNDKLENPQKFQMFRHTNMNNIIVYRLIENISETGYLSYQCKHFDFFLQCMDNSNINKIISTLKREPDINYVSLLENPEKELIQKLSI